MSNEYQFIAFHGTHPDEGEICELEIADPDYARAKAAHREVLERNPFAQSMAIETMSPSLSGRGQDLIGAHELCVASRQVTLVVGYPFSGQYAVTVHAASPRGFTRAELFTQIVAVYSAMYDNAPAGSGELKLQSRVESPRFGTAWHQLDELVIEQVLLDKHRDGRVFAWIMIGS